MKWNLGEKNKFDKDQDDRGQMNFSEEMEKAKYFDEIDKIMRFYVAFWR